MRYKRYKFDIGDLVVAKDKNWLVDKDAIGATGRQLSQDLGDSGGYNYDLILNSFHVIGIENEYYVLVHINNFEKYKKTMFGKEFVLRWNYYNFEAQFEIDVKLERKKKLDKLKSL